MLARLLTRQGNRVGALFYGDRVDTVIPARGGRRHVLAHAAPAAAAPRAAADRQDTDLRDFLRTAFQVMPRRSLVFIVSDFFSEPGWAEPLAHLAQRHEVVAVRLYDPLERELPDMGMLVMQDSETGEQLFVDTHDKGFRKRFASVAERRERELRPALSRAGVDCLELATDGDLVDALMRFADLRKRRSRLAGGGMPSTWSKCRMKRRMNFLWPEALWLLALLPLLLLLYVWLLRRKRKAAVRYANLGMIKEAMGAGSKIRRHVPPALFLLALAALIVAMARPVATVTLPTQKQTIILALDASGSMRAKDVEPSRLVAMQNAAQAVRHRRLAANTKIGIVTFAAHRARWCSRRPRTARRSLAAIDRIQLQRATATGSGLIVSLATLFPDAGFDVSTALFGRDAPRSAPHRASAKKDGAKKDFKPVRAGLLQLRGDHPAHRRPAHHRPRPDRDRQARRRPRRARLHRGLRHHLRARSSASRAGRSACAWTRKR